MFVFKIIQQQPLADPGGGTRFFRRYNLLPLTEKTQMFSIVESRG